MTIRFDVVGHPAPQGNKTPIVVPDRGGKPRAVLVEGANKTMRERHKNWRSAVAEAASRHAPVDGPLDGPLVVLVRFRFPMAASRSQGVHAAGWCPKVSAPDSDKLLRSLGDSLKEGGLIADDARFVLSLVAKVEVVGWTGAEVTVRRYTGSAGGLDAWLQPTLHERPTA